MAGPLGKKPRPQPDNRIHACVLCDGDMRVKDGDMCSKCIRARMAETSQAVSVSVSELTPLYEVMFKGNDAPVGFIPAVMLFEMGRVQVDGAKKHGGAYNWRKGETQKLMYHCNAALGHVLQFIEGEDVASDSGLSHLAHACAQLAIALDKMKYRNDVDDRPNNG